MFHFTKSVILCDGICWINAIWNLLSNSTIVKPFHMVILPKLEAEVENCKNQTAEEFKSFVTLLIISIKNEFEIKETYISLFEDQLLILEDNRGYMSNEILCALLLQNKMFDYALFENENNNDE